MAGHCSEPTWLWSEINAVVSVRGQITMFATRRRLSSRVLKRLCEKNDYSLLKAYHKLHHTRRKINFLMQTAADFYSFSETFLRLALMKNSRLIDSRLQLLWAGMLMVCWLAEIKSIGRRDKKLSFHAR